MRTITALCALLVCAPQAPGQMGDLDDEDFAEFQELMEIIDEETTLATKTKLNSDYVPGMVTVLQGGDLEALGVATVWEALSLVPGMQIYRGGLGEPFVTVRGMQFPFNSGNIKLMVNSSVLSRETSSMNTSVLLLPIEQVERIEIMRGPGSSVYGDFAFMGLVNIITRSGGRRVFVGTTDGDHRSGGVQVGGGAGDLRYDFNLAGWQSAVGTGNANEVGDEDRLAAIGALHWRGSTLSYQLFDRSHAVERIGLSIEEHNQSLGFGHRAEWDAGYVDFSAQYLSTDTETPGQKFKGDVLKTGVDLGWQGSRVDWLLALTSTRADIDLVRLERAVLAELRDEAWSDFSASLQGQYEVREGLIATAGLRFDRRGDIEASRLTPRVALVYRLRETHLIKGQYSQGYRAPTFFERFGQDLASRFDLDFETIGMAEASYIYRDARRTARVTFFDADLRDMVFPEFGPEGPPAAGAPPPGFGDVRPPPGGGPPRGDGPPRGGGPPPGGNPAGRVVQDGLPAPPDFLNKARGDMRGVEIEWEQQVGAAVKLMGNLSYADATDTRSFDGTYTEAPSLVSAQWLGTAGAIFRPRRNLVLSGHLYYVAERTYGANPLPSYADLDLTLNIYHFAARGITLRAGLKNALDREIRYVVAAPRLQPSRVFDPRRWWLRLAYEL